jgi:hypothetical protein
MVASDSPIFIVGTARSGTTLMASMLDAHPRLNMLPIETEIFSLWQRRWRHLDLGKPDDFERFWAEFSTNVRFKQLDLDLIRPRLTRSHPSNAKFILTTIAEIDAEKNGKKRWGEKTPNHWTCIDRILRAYPDAQIIIMVRDPRACVASILKTPWNVLDEQGYSRQWVDFVHVLRQWASDKRVRIASYENLIKEPVQVLGDLCGWLGEEYSDSMLDRSRLADRLNSLKGWQLEHYQKALKPISIKSLSAWRTELDSNQIAIIEHVCGKLMREFGYEIEGKPLGIFQVIKLDLSYWWSKRKLYLRKAKHKLWRAKKAALHFSSLSH